MAWWEWLAVGLATLGGVFLRFWALDAIPPGLWYDEAIYGLDGLDVLRGINRPVFFDTYGHMREPLYMYLLAMGLALGPVEAATIRAVSAVIGSLTIPVTWWMAREVAGPRVALWTVLVFAPMRWHVHFSRTAFRVILSPLFAALSMALLARFLRRPSWHAGALWGLALGACLYTYLSMRLFVIIIGGLLLLAIWQSRSRPVILKHSILAVALAVCVFVPLGIDFVRNPDHFSGRTDEVSLFDEGRGGWTRLLAQARDVALMSTIRGDHEPRHSIPGWPQFNQAYLLSNRPQEAVATWADLRRMDPEAMPDVHGTGAPVFDVITGMLFMAALVLTIARALRGCWPSAVLAAWVVFGSLVSVLSFGAPNMLRMLFVTPAVACVLAIGLEAIWTQLRSRLLVAKWAAAFMGLLLLWYGAGEVRRYFNDWASSPGIPEAFNTNLVEISEWLREHPDRPQTLVLPQYLMDTPSIRFEMDRITGKVSDSDWEPGNGRVWLLAPIPPYPPLNVEERVIRAANILQRFHMPNGTEWAVVLEWEGGE